MNWWLFDAVCYADILIILICLFVAFFLCKKLKQYGKKIYWLFVTLAVIHYLITPYNALTGVDSVEYFSNARDLSEFILGQRGLLVESVAWVLIHYFGLSFLGCNFVFSLLGLLGWYFLVLVLIDVRKQWSKWFLFLLLPELHYWTCFLGKDALIFFSICAIVYIWYFQKSFLYYIIPCIIIGYIRAPVLLVVLAAFGLSYLFQSKIHFTRKILLGVLSLVAISIFLPMAVEQTRMEEFDMENVEDYISRNERYHQDEEFGSSVDMQGLPIYEKMFAYQFRPLFYDAVGYLQMEASFENACWLLVFLLTCLRFKRKYFLWFPFLAYMALWAGQSFALNNLGIAMRQKMMFFPFFMILFFRTLKDSKEKKTTSKLNRLKKLNPQNITPY